jgi:uncharacterized protein (TIGR02145 family)
MLHTVSRTKIFLLVAVLVIGFPALWQAARLFAGSPVTDDFSDTTKIASSENLTIDTVTGRVMLTANATWSCGQNFTDTRDGQAYPTVLIGTQCWMGKNMNIGTMTGGTVNQTNNGTIEKYCYANNSSNCTTYGGLYQWNEAMQYSIAPGAQGICPTGWHIPTHDEFTTLERAVCTSGTCATDFPYDITTIGWRGTNEGTTLKTGSFAGLLAGNRGTDGSFGGVGTLGSFWSSVQSGADAWRRTLHSGYATVFRNALSQLYGFSVRCLKD